MGRYIYNPTKAPQMFGQRTFPPGNYDVISEVLKDTIHAAGVPVLIEKDPEFKSLWAVNIPDQTPNNIP